MRKDKNKEPVSTEIVTGKSYNKTELGEIADQLLRDNARSEICQECGEAGDKTGNSQVHGTGLQDQQGNELIIEYEEVACEGGHIWFLGEGKERGIGGDNPILFEEHFQSRRRREIYCALGTPDPSIVAGLYNRVHPQGRKVNTEVQRKRHGASFYR